MTEPKSRCYNGILTYVQKESSKPIENMLDSQCSQVQLKTDEIPELGEGIWREE